MTESSHQPESATAESMLAAGVAAPNFTLSSDPDTTVSLSDFLGRPVVLVFYPADWSPVCGDQLALYNEIMPEFDEFNAQLLGVSVDSIWSHKAYAESRKLRFPLLADFQPRGKVGQLFGVYDDKSGEENRALFVIDGEGTISWSYMGSTWKNPGAAGILKALKALTPVEGAK